MAGCKDFFVLARGSRIRKLAPMMAPPSGRSYGSTATLFSRDEGSNAGPTASKFMKDMSQKWKLAKYRANLFKYNTEKKLDNFLHGKKENVQQVSFMITREMRQQLFDLSYSREDIASLRPDDAHAIIAANISVDTFRAKGLDGLRKQFESERMQSMRELDLPEEHQDVRETFPKEKDHPVAIVEDKAPKETAESLPTSETSKSAPAGSAIAVTKDSDSPQ